MEPDRNKINYFSGDANDEIVYENTITIVNDGATTNDPQSSKIVTQNITNPYGIKAMVRFAYSVDGVNYNDAESHLFYGYTITVPAVPITVNMGGLRAAVSVGISDTEIKFRTANGYHGNVTQVGATYTYTPISQTFYIKYAIYEVE